MRRGHRARAPFPRHIPAHPRPGWHARTALRAHLHRAHPGICPSRPAAGVFIHRAAGECDTLQGQLHSLSCNAIYWRIRDLSRLICTTLTGYAPRGPRQVSSSRHWQAGDENFGFCAAVTVGNHQGISHRPSTSCRKGSYFRGNFQKRKLARPLIFPKEFLEICVRGNQQVAAEQLAGS